MKQHTQNTISHTVDLHCGLNTPFPTQKDSSSHLGNVRLLSAMTIKALAMILIATFMVSCEKEIEFNGEQSDPRLVINSIITPGQRVEARISKSYFFLDINADTQAPDDLVATLYVNGNRIGEMTPFVDTIYEPWGLHAYYLIPGFYSDYRPQEGDIVSVTASANGFEDVEGSTSALPKVLNCPLEVEIENWHSSYFHPHFDEYGEYEEDSLLNVWGYLNLTFTITDPNPGKTDCFRLITSRNSNMSVDQNSRHISFDYDDPIFETGMTENEFFDASDLDTRPEGVFTDMLFDGSSYRLKVKVHFDCELDEDFDPDFFRVPFMVEHLSKEYYNYLNTCNQGDEINSLYAEPIHTYSNVTNGFGIVAGRAVDTLWVDLPLQER